MTIKEVSEKYDLSADTIHYYERIGLIDYVSLFFQEGTESARKDILVEQLDTLQSTMKRLDYKISHYDEILKCSEKLKS